MKQELIKKAKKEVGGLYAMSGGDVDSCEFCGKKLNDRKPWRRGMDGAGAHEDCIPKW